MSIIAEQYKIALANVSALRWAWLLIFSAASVIQIAVWPDLTTLACVLLAWTATLATGLVILRASVTVLFPWSSLLLLMFCLQNISLPLVLMTLQGDPIDHNLQVPVWTFLHLSCCALVLLSVHWGYRHLLIGQFLRLHLQNTVLKPMGLFTKIPEWQLWGVGLVGFICAVYVYVFVRAEQGGEIAITGPVWQRVANGLIPFAFVPFLLLLPKQVIGIIGAGNRWISRLLLVIYAMLILLLAMAFNCRAILFVGLAMASVVGLLLGLTGQIRLELKRIFWLGLIGVVFIVTIGADFAVALRVAREDRANKSAGELIHDTFSALTTGREQLDSTKDNIKSGQDKMDAWYVTSPVLSRFVNTHFQDHALSCVLSLGPSDISKLREVEWQRLVCTLPNPVVKLLAPDIDKNEVSVGSIGDWLQVLDGEKNQIGGYGAGGFIGDGYALFGWFYFIPLGLIGFLFFVLSDAFYLVLNKGPFTLQQGIGVFALVALANAYALATALNTESFCGLLAFLMRQPLQWLVLFILILCAFKLIILCSSPLRFTRATSTCRKRVSRQLKPEIP